MKTLPFEQIGQKASALLFSVFFASLLVLLTCTTAHAQQTFPFTGASQTYTVPAGAVGVQIQARGAGGGGGGSDGQPNTDGGAGGAGALAAGRYPVAGGTNLSVVVGGFGGSAQSNEGGTGNSCASTAGSAGASGGTGGYAGSAGSTAGCSPYSGGGGGGGAASVVATAANVPILVAGGGGGGQGGSLNGNGVNGLTSGATGTIASVAAGQNAGAPGSDGGGGGGGGGGCAPGIGGLFKPDNQLPNPSHAAGAGGSCSAGTVTGFTVTSGGGGAGGTGAVAYNWFREVANGARPGANGQVTISPIYQFGITKSNPSPALALNTPSNYTLTVTNTGLVAATPRVVDLLPVGMAFNSGTGTNWNCTAGTPGANGTLITCIFTGTLAVNATSNIIINATPTTGTLKLNRASVDASGGVNPPDPSTCTALNTPQGCAAPVTSTLPELGISKSQPAPAFQVGATSAYTITVQNIGSGPTPASTTARFQDQLPANVTFVSATGTGWSCSTAANGSGTLVTCNYSGASVAAGAFLPNVQLQVTPTTNQQITNFVAVDPRPGGTTVPAPTTCTAVGVPTRGCGAPVVSTIGLAVSGRVYLDANANNSLDGVESETGLGALFVKLSPSSGTACSGPATLVSTVVAATGVFSIANVAQGNYCLILDGNNTLSDITPSVPAGYIGTENASGIIQITVSAAPEPPQNFGLYNGSQLSGVVFLDTGIGAGGVANNGIRDGTEAGLGGVLVEVFNAAVVVASATTVGNGTYTVFVPGPVGARVVTPVLPSNYLATGGSTGNTGGTYSQATNSLTYTTVAGTSRTNANFGIIPPNTFAANGAQSTAPGSVVFYSHTYSPGSTGSVSFALSALATPVIAGWTQVLYRDSNCNAVFDPAEPQITAAIAATAGVPICLIVRQQVPPGASLGAQNTVTVSATMDYANDTPALIPPVLVVTDTTTVAENSSIALAKLVRNVTTSGVSSTTASAAPGQTLEYTITATNNGSQNATTLVINDATPTFTNYLNAVCVLPLPAGITGCTVNIQPAVAAAGAVQWTLVGSLTPSVQVAVRFQVRVDQ